MGRPPRPVGEGATYHVTARGNDHQTIYLTDADRHGFLTTLARVCERHDWTCHAYCLMGNHFHLAVTTPAANLPAGMCQLVGQYARLFNRKHRRTNHLFGSRYHAALIETDGHLLATVRYISRNPSRAGLVSAPHEWPWSSYRAALGLTHPPGFLNPTPVLAMLHPDPTTGRRLLRQFIDETAGDQPKGPESRP